MVLHLCVQSFRFATIIPAIVEVEVLFASAQGSVYVWVFNQLGVISEKRRMI